MLSENAANLSKVSQQSYLGLLTIALGNAVLKNGGVPLTEWNVCLLVLAVAAGMHWLRTAPQNTTGGMQPLLRWAILLFLAYVALQLVPLPLFLLRILSPARAELAERLGKVMRAEAFAPLTIDPATTFAYLFRIIGYTVTFLVIRDIASRSSERRQWAAVIPLVGIGSVEAGFGLLQRMRGTEVHGTYGNKNHFAGLLEMVLPLTIMYGIALFRTGNSHHRSSASRVLKGCGALLLAAGIFIGLLYSMSKMGFVATLCAMSVMVALAVTVSTIEVWKKLLSITCLVGAFLFLFLFLPQEEVIQGFGGAFSTRGAIGEGRWPIWHDTLHLIGAYPFFGCGLGNYATAFLKYQTAVVDREFTFAHNDFLELTAELGILGFLILGLLMFGISRNAFRAATRGPDRNTHYLGLGCVGAITAIGLHSLTDFNMYIPANALLLSWISGIAAALPSQSARPAVDTAVPGGFSFKRFALVLSSLLIVYAPAWILFEIAFRSDVRAERLFCRFGICDTDAVVASQISQHGGLMDAVPPIRLLEALQRDPAAPNRWCDLGEAMYKSRRIAEARYCFSNALALGPYLPPILMRTANFYQAVQETQRAVEQTSRILQKTDSYDGLVFDWYRAGNISVTEILCHGVSGNARASEAYLRYLMDARNTTDSGKVWNWMVSRGYADDPLATQYVDFLFKEEDYKAAANSWVRYASHLDKGYPESNRIFNGDFEFDPTGSRFDWMIEPPPGARIDFDRHAHYSGARSLRIQFDGTQNPGNIGVRQTVFLKSGQYRFRAYVRTKELSTDEGLTFSVVDEQDPKRLSFKAEGIAGSNDWKSIEHTFRVSAGTGLVQVSLVRKPSWKFDNLIRGTVWIDQVSITPDTQIAAMQ